VTGLALTRAGARPELRRYLAATLAGLAVWGLFASWTPTGGREASLCLLRRLLVPCPGCGMTRAVAYLTKGEWYAAWVAHPLVFLLAAEVLLAWMVYGVLLLRGRDPGAIRRSLKSRALGGWAVAHGLLFLGVWAYRLATGHLPW
jgi:hypothetical protein